MKQPSYYNNNDNPNIDTPWRNIALLDLWRSILSVWVKLRFSGYRMRTMIVLENKGSISYVLANRGRRNTLKRQPY